MASIKDYIHEIEDASEKMLGADHEDHLAKDLFMELLNKAMTPEEVQEIEDRYLNNFEGDDILKMVHDLKLEKGFIKD